MTRTALPLPIADLSAFAKALAPELPEPPGHLSLLNMLARAAGFRNVQHLRASQKAEGELQTAPEPLPDLTRVAAALRHFDAKGQMTSWPARTVLQHLCLWALWSRLPKQPMTERQISQALTTLHSFGDPAILRRTLWELRLVTRTPDCTLYQRQEQKPPPEPRALIAALHRRL